MQNKIIITNKNVNVRLVKSAGGFLIFSGFVFMLSTGLMISESISVQRISKNNIIIKKQLEYNNQEILNKSIDIYNKALSLGFEYKKDNQRYFVEKTVDGKYTYLFR